MFCKSCGYKIEDGHAFCPKCGTKQTTVYRHVFERAGLSEQDFISNINIWFQRNPKAANIKCSFDIDTALGVFANKYELNTFTIEYELFENNNQNQYGLIKEENYSLMSKSSKDYISQWKESHPQVTVLNWKGGTHSRGQVGSHLLGGLGASNRLNMYIFFKFPRKN